MIQMNLFINNKGYAVKSMYGSTDVIVYSNLLAFKDSVKVFNYIIIKRNLNHKLTTKYLNVIVS